LADIEGFLKKVLSNKKFRSALSADEIKRFSSKKFLEEYKQRYPNSKYVQSHLSVLRENMAALQNNYVMVVMGSDMDLLPGIASHLELEYMVNAGMNTLQAIMAATTLNAQFLGGIKTTGTLEAGKFADMVILDADPLVNIKNTRNIRTVIKHGKMFDPKRLLKEIK
jgi:imidazolonepropionase-like amidohydrolase